MSAVDYQVAIRARDLWVRRAAKHRFDAQECRLADDHCTAVSEDQKADAAVRLAKQWDAKAKAIQDQEAAADDFED